jgi:DNA polymerase-3 subunit psi
MLSKKQAYLSEMEIEQWQLLHQDRMKGLTVKREDLPSGVRLLLVCPVDLPSEHVPFLEKVLGSFDVKLNEVLVTQPHLLSTLGKHSLQWIWFVDCAPQNNDVPKQLTSQGLGVVSASPTLKKALWNQILAFKEP